jgi:hypothetical protein
MERLPETIQSKKTEAPSARFSPRRSPEGTLPRAERGGVGGVLTQGVRAAKEGTR